MKKKILTSLLMGAFLFASTSMITSCKDYDDDINDLKALVNQNSTALDQAKSDLQGKIDKLSSDLSTLNGELTNLKTEAAKHATKDELKTVKDALDQEIKDREAAISGLDSRLKTAETALTNLNSLIGGELTGDLKGLSYNEAVMKIYGQMESVQSELGSALTRIQVLENALNDPKTGWKAVDADLQQQITAINTYLGKYGAGDETVAKQLADLKKKLEELSKQGYDDTAIKNDIQGLKEQMKNLNAEINEINANINVLNVLIQQRLRSLVFIPDAYYWGIEATSFNYLDAFQYTLSETAYDKKEVRGYEYGNKKFDDKVSDDALAQAGARTDHKDGRYDSTAYTSVMDLWANYHLNPSDVIIDQIADVQVIDADKDYVLTRASEAQITTKKDKDGKSIYKIKDGVMSVQLDVKNPDKIKSVLKGLVAQLSGQIGQIIRPNADGTAAEETAATVEKPMVTIFATQAYLNGDGSEKDTIITSDYATLYADIYSNIRLSHKLSTKENPIPFTGVENIHCGDCSLTPAKNANETIQANDSLHLMATVHEAAFFAPQDTCNYDETLDLRKLVETHWDNISGMHEVVPADKMAEYGLTYKFELTGLWIGSNETSESAHAAINPEDGYTFRPQMVEQGTGKQQAYGAEQGLQTVGRTPVVRVSLLDKYGKVLDYGYIRIKITRKGTEVPYEYKEVTYDGNDGSYLDECEFDAEGYQVYKTTWYQTEYDLYKLVNMAREDFENIYEEEPVTGQDGYQQFIKKDGKWVPCEEDEILGTLTNTPDLTDPETHTQSSTLIYELTSEDIDALYAQWTNKKAEKTFTVERAYKYEPNTVGYSDIYVVFKTDVTFKPMPQYSATIDWANHKTEKYWYVKNTAEQADVTKDDVTYELHTNVPAVEDEIRADADDLHNLFSTEFRGNDVIIASMVKSDQEGFNAADWTYTLVFDKSNVGKKFMGNDGKEYTLSVSADGKQLLAKTGSRLPEVIAELVLTDDSKAGQKDEADYTQVVYQHGTAAEALLNYASHSEFNDKNDAVLNKTLTAIIGVKAVNECQELTLSNKTFNVRFLRPIDVINKDAEIEDASTDGMQIINLLDLVWFKDWRDAWKGDNPGGSYYTYYGIKGVFVGDAEVKLADGEALSSTDAVKANLDHKGMEQLNNITNQLDFIYSSENGGQLVYKNVSSTVQTFELQIPIRVEYIWGNVYTTATVTVNRTHHNAKAN